MKVDVNYSLVHAAIVSLEAKKNLTVDEAEATLQKYENNNEYICKLQKKKEELEQRLSYIVEADKLQLSILGRTFRNY
ncbi:hypothetical protein LIS82_26690 (plasmid) [Cytobacillus solani]|uniref:hypothetical protein n=1 Tax=Cytobacillus solani TaxID=1637975 RepID=UPI002079ECFB|nr:hypothetical protein [Cytobacillus solani]USK57813.1 hypothetical protein LIS82_26690 [Cytobacillus solani]